MYCIFNRAKVNLIDGCALSRDPSRYRKPQEDIDHTLSADNKFIEFLNRTSGLLFLDNGAGANVQNIILPDTEYSYAPVISFM